MLGEICEVLKPLGEAYVGLLQMTVLPYLIVSLVAKMGRLDVDLAKRLGWVALGVLAILWTIGIALIVAVNAVLPPIEGASFYSAVTDWQPVQQSGILNQFVPSNVFSSLANEIVPAVVIFCLFFGVALIRVPGKEKLINWLEVCSNGLSEINVFLIKLAPIGLFLLTASAAGTLRMEELARLQAYLLILLVACLIAAYVALPLLVSSVTSLGYRQVVRATHEPILTVIATGKLFVVLPLIVERCEDLLRQQHASHEKSDSVASVVVPLAYPFPHLGKILPLVFICFAAWYSGQVLSPEQAAVMAGMGTVSSFASPLTTMPFLLDHFRLPQDLMTFFILPGFVTTRLADIVGVVHLTSMTLIVSQLMTKRLELRWARLGSAVVAALVAIVLLGGAGRWYLQKTNVAYDLDDQLLSLRLPEPHPRVKVYREPVNTVPHNLSTIERVRQNDTLWVGYHPDHVPYSFFNSRGDLVGYDVDLIHRLAADMDVAIHFVPFEYDTVVGQLDAGQLDLVIGGIMLHPERLLMAEFTKPYESATLAVVLPDHYRSDIKTWKDLDRSESLTLGVIYKDLAREARRRLQNVRIEEIESFRSFFKGESKDLDGLIMAAEEGAAWNVLHPKYSVIVPTPIAERPVAMATQRSDGAWLRLLNRWIEYSRRNGDLTKLRRYWVEGAGTQERGPRWCILRDVWPILGSASE